MMVLSEELRRQADEIRRTAIPWTERDTRTVRLLEIAADSLENDHPLVPLDKPRPCDVESTS